MMKYIFVALVCMCAMVSAQTVDVITIDPFEVDTPAVVIILGENETFPVCDQDFTQDGSIIGGERGIQFCASNGAENSVLTAGTSSGAFSCASPSNAGGFATLQYDGIDGTMDLDPSGLFSDPENDWTVASGFGLRTVVESDFTTTAEVQVYSGSANDYCSATITIPGGSNFENVNVEYQEFSAIGAGCDFSNVGAFQFIVQVDNDVDVVISQISVVGPIIYNECTCVCPEFTCIIAIDHDDDGFVYYATSDFDDDGFNNPTTDLSTLYSTATYSFSTGNDDDDDDSSSGSPSSGDDDDDNGSSSSSSDASALAVTPALFAVVLALVL